MSGEMSPQQALRKLEKILCTMRDDEDIAEECLEVLWESVLGVESPV